MIHKKNAMKFLENLEEPLGFKRFDGVYSEAY